MIIYGLFWLGVIGFVAYDFVIATSSDGDLSLGWVLITGFFYLSIIMGIVGIISRAIVLYRVSKGKRNKMRLVHAISLSSIFILPHLLHYFLLLGNLVQLLFTNPKLFIPIIRKMINRFLLGN